jgi:RES domain-containing protein
LALLEALVHLEIDSFAGLPSHYQLLQIDAPDEMLRETLGDSLLGAGWPADMARTRAIGDAWLLEGDAALLSVPSAVVPSARNWLINPMHRDATRLAIAGVVTFPFDKRLAKPRGPARKA